MTRVIYVNGLYQHYHDAVIHAEDRGFLFADGVYEVCEVKEGALVDETRHMQRMERSLQELKISSPMSFRAIGRVLRETVRRNRVRNGMVYIQITRGVARRDFIFPGETVKPSIMCFARSLSRQAAEIRVQKGVKVITMPDMRWKRPDIKSVALLPNVLAKQAAKEQGAFEAWMYDEKGYITEGSSSNAWILTNENVLMTRPAHDQSILRGITRSVVFDLLTRENIRFEERSFTVEEAKQAKEAFMTSATALITPIIRIDDTQIGNGQPGPITLKIRKDFHSQAEIRK